MNFNPLARLSNRVASAFNYEKKGVGSFPADTTFWKSFSQMLGTQQGITDPYAQSVWVYSAVKKIATNIAGVPFKLYTGIGEEEKKEVTEGEIFDLLNHPNPDTTAAMLWESTQSYLDLRGDAFWIMERSNIAAVPDEIRVVDPHRMIPAFNRNRTALIGWVYSVGTTKIPFDLHEVLHLKYFNPNDPLFGIAPYQSISIVADQDYFANIYNKTFFKEGAAISGFIEADKGLTNTQYSRLINQVNDRHQGMTKAHRIGLLENGAKFKETKLSQKDMDFIESKKMGKKEIYTAYGTNDVVQGFFEDVKSYEGMKTAMKAFWEGTLIPRTKLLQEAVSIRFLKPMTGGRIYGEFDLSDVSALKEDFTNKVENGKKLFDMGYPINDINKRLDMGMEEQKHGGTGYLPATLVPTDGSGSTESNTTEGDDEEKMLGSASRTKQLEAPKTKQAEEEEEELERTEEDAAIWENLLSIQTPIENQFKSGVRRYFMEQRVRVLAGLDAYFKRNSLSDVIAKESSELAKRAYAEGIAKGITDDIFDGEGERERLKDTLLPLYDVAIAAGAEMVADEIGVTFTFDPLDPTFLKYQEIRITGIAPEMISTVEEALRLTLTEGIVAGEGVALLAERVKAVYGFAIARATTIARTEAGSMLEAGRYQNMINHGIVEHEWFTAIDEGVRDTHKWLHGSRIMIGQKFQYIRGLRSGQTSPLRYPTDMRAPAAQVINCRCITLPVIR